MKQETNLEFKKNIVLAPYTSWLVGGPAEYFCLPKNKDEIIQAVEFAEKQKLKLTVLGGGSNVLIADEGISGLVICLKNFSGLQIESQSPRLELRVLSGTGKSELLKTFLKFKLAPALFLAGLPGDVGGGVVMNAGVAEAFLPREFVEIVDWVEVLKKQNTNWSVQIFRKEELRWSYRHSNGWQPGIITEVGISWENNPDETILAKVKEANRLRLSKQPLDMPSCGSVFVNPPGHKAAQLIDQCGLKGFQIGDAQVSMKHANFIVNLGTAKAADIWSVIEHVKKIVFQKTKIALNTEVVKL